MARCHQHPPIGSSLALTLAGGQLFRAQSWRRVAPFPRRQKQVQSPGLVLPLGGSLGLVCASVPSVLVFQNIHKLLKEMQVA